MSQKPVITQWLQASSSSRQKGSNQVRGSRTNNIDHMNCPIYLHELDGLFLPGVLALGFFLPATLH